KVSEIITCTPASLMAGARKCLGFRVRSTSTSALRHAAACKRSPGSSERSSVTVRQTGRCRWAAAQGLERGAQRVGSGASLLALGSDIHDVLHTYATVVAVG